ncbi:MAG: T9SS type A sorting domain-containing protein [Ignavibacteria bacterium]|nr:T9SS type A sorting domain-containing protein [Ignavibacteria bacterium]
MQTETEVNNYGFEILRSAKYDTVWIKIGFVEGSGNSNSPKEYFYMDEVIKYGSYAYRLKQIDTDGQFEFSKVIEVDAGNIPNGFVLEQNYPNPFNPITKINFSLPNPSKVSIKIYDILGRTVKILIDEFRDKGIHTVTFDGTGLASGVYFYSIESGNFKDTKKMVLVK